MESVVVIICILHGPPVRLQELLQQKRSNYDSNQTIKIED